MLPSLATSTNSRSAAMISVSIVSHGQRDIALEFLRKVAFLKPTMVSRIVYTCNVPEEALPALDFGHIELQVIRNARPQGFGEPQCRLPS